MLTRDQRHLLGSLGAGMAADALLNRLRAPIAGRGSFCIPGERMNPLDPKGGNVRRSRTTFGKRGSCSRVEPPRLGVYIWRWTPPRTS